VPRPPGRGLVGRLLATLRGRQEPAGDEPAAGEDGFEAERRIDAARERLKTEIPPRED
jgi:hypothetical protein